MASGEGLSGTGTEPIDVLFALSEEEWVPAVAVAIRTAVRAATDPTRLRIHIAELEISAASQATLLRSLRDLPAELHVHHIEPEQLAGYPTRGRFRLSTWIRVLAPVLLPTAEKMIYLDCDIVVLRDLAHLWEIDLGDNAIAAVRDRYERWDAREVRQSSLPDSPGVRAYLGRAPSKEDLYVNAGVMVCNLRRWRELNAMEVLRWIAIRIGHELPYLDQDALNLAFHNQILELDSVWNDMQVVEYDRHYKDQPAADHPIHGMTSSLLRRLEASCIVHFAGAGKPWDPAYWGAVLREIWRNADQWNRHHGRRTTWHQRALPMAQDGWHDLPRIKALLRSQWDAARPDRRSEPPSSSGIEEGPSL